MNAMNPFFNYLERKLEEHHIPWYVGQFESKPAVLDSLGKPVVIDCKDFAEAEAILHSAERLMNDEEGQSTSLNPTEREFSFKRFALSTLAAAA